METDRSSKKIALQLVGSPTSQFYFELSVLYAAPVVCPPGFDLLFLVVYPDGNWSIGPTLEVTDDRLTLAEILPKIADVDLVVPHLFCPSGLTAYRSFFEEVLELPLVGSSGKVLQLAQQKQLTRLVAQSCGVRTAPGLLVDMGSGNIPYTAIHNLHYPLIVKPDESDNSDGLTLVKSKDELDAALQSAAKYGDRVVVEKYIPGREIRGAVIEIEGELTVLPFIEYEVSETYPIREAQDKLKTDDEGKIEGQSAKERIPATCPAKVDQPLADELGGAMRKMHRALGCRDFSLYDFRVHAATGDTYLLEAGLFWSFGEVSMISGMLRAGGLDLLGVTECIWEGALNRNVRM